MRQFGLAGTGGGSDLGQANNPLPVDAYARMVRGLLDAGVSKEDLRRLIADSPADLLGI
ncbi:hypothetical protein [Sinomonas atrocyanea]|uniref:hypothetical protein n=1 Tax=Sinomonas atrocyanea TaxID=37927 RepID=UPI0012EE507F|nr:hypothetical protein [Sinomonas atrocyanea]